jgi:molybdopterin molybdotransferase
MPPSEPQRLPSRLTPLADVRARIDALARPVEARAVDVAAAVGHVLGAEAAFQRSLPAAAIALRDGWAVRSDSISDAGPYAPVTLMPPPKFVEIGAPLPPNTDAILPPDAVSMRAGMAETTASALPGDGVLGAGADAAAGQILRRAGERLRTTDFALLRAIGVSHVCVRVPCLVVITANVFIDAVDDTAAPLIARDIEAVGGTPQIVRGASDGTPALEDALAKSQQGDAVVVIGGTGAGRHDASVCTLARLGTVHVHGVGLVPGETAALGALGTRPVLILPGRLDAALAAWLVLGRHLMMRLTGCDGPDAGTPVHLARKIASTVGMADVVLVRRCENGIEPIASGYFPLHALAEADGYVLVAPEREGFPPGATVAMHALP